MTNSSLVKKLAAKLRRLYWKTVLRFQDTVTVRTEQGLFTVSCSDQVIGKDLFCSREFELEMILDITTALQRASLFPTDGQGTLIDIGANIGPIAIAMLQLGLVEKAIVIEPDPGNFALLERNVRQNHLGDRVICLPYAVSCDAGTVEFELSPTNSGDHRVRMGIAESEAQNQHGESGRKVIQVPSKPLDDLLDELPSDFTDNISLIWIDVQGHEGQAFLGAQQAIARGVPVVAEIWPYGIHRAGVQADEFCGLATELWTEAWMERHGRFEPLPVADLIKLFNVPDPKGRYFENVIFTGAAQQATGQTDLRAA
jgi:FkbM family methyltransferase